MTCLRVKRIQYREWARWYAIWVFRIACAVAAFAAAYYLTEAYSWAVTQAHQEVAQANKERDEVYLVLNGKKAMVEYAGKYAVVERVTYEVRK